MEILASSDIKEVLKNKYLLVDTNFLKELYKREFLKEFLPFIKHCHLWLDPLIVFEFLRDVFDSSVYKKKTSFVDSSLFNKAINHNDIFIKIQENALLLSKIYAHKGKAKGVNTIDLFLAARLMKMTVNTLIITENKKDFPSIIFDLEAVLSIEDPNNDRITNYCVLKFNVEKFNACYQELLKVKGTVLN